MIIMKFGGTSVNTASKIKTIAQLVRRYKKQNPVVVVSAMRGVTDKLLELSDKENFLVLQEIRTMYLHIAQEILGGKSLNRVEDYIDSCFIDIIGIVNTRRKNLSRTDCIIAYGEFLSAFLISAALAYWNIPSKFIVSTKLIVTDNSFGSADFMVEKTKINTKKILLPLLEKNVTPVVTGFIGATERGETTTLGRGGSDYSASILGYCLNVSEIQFWKDVDGIYTADPHVVTNAKLLENLSYEEASIIVENGAKVLHPRAILPMSDANIPLRVMNTLRPDRNGTLITKREETLI